MNTSSPIFKIHKIHITETSPYIRSVISVNYRYITVLCAFLEVITWPPSRYQAYRPGNSILARGPIWSAGPICLVTRRRTSFNLFITCLFSTFKISSMVNLSVNKTCFDASEILGFT